MSMAEARTFSILIVDDEASNLHILNQILKEHYTVFAARSGKAALKISGEKKPDLILLDVILPDISGFEVLSALKDSEKTCNIPVIIISGLSGTADEQTALSLGAVDYITKPFNSSTVKVKIEEYLKYGQ